jgi:hypothetical protein
MRRERAASSKEATPSASASTLHPRRLAHRNKTGVIVFQPQVVDFQAPHRLQADALPTTHRQFPQDLHTQEPLTFLSVRLARLGLRLDPPDLGDQGPRQLVVGIQGLVQPQG